MKPCLRCCLGRLFLSHTFLRHNALMASCPTQRVKGVLAKKGNGPQDLVIQPTHSNCLTPEPEAKTLSQLLNCYRAVRKCRRGACVSVNPGESGTGRGAARLVLALLEGKCHRMLQGAGPVVELAFIYKVKKI